MSGTETTTTGANAASSYVHPEVLVETSWVAEHLNDPNVRLIEADEDVLLYEVGHIPGAVKLDWHVDVQDRVNRDFVNQKEFEQLMSRWGITNDTTIVLYGDKNNWYACYSFWLFTMYGLVDVRSPQEYTGELIHMVNYPQEGAQRGGHIPGAKSIPWAMAANADGTFKTPEELRQIYGSNDITPDKDVITYCRIGERSAHTWFVLTELLGYPRVRNYDGSWTEWGNLVRAPIEK